MFAGVNFPMLMRILSRRVEPGQHSTQQVLRHQHENVLMKWCQGIVFGTSLFHLDREICQLLRQRLTIQGIAMIPVPQTRSHEAFGSAEPEHMHHVKVNRLNAEAWHTAPVRKRNMVPCVVAVADFSHEVSSVRPEICVSQMPIHMRLSRHAHMAYLIAQIIPVMEAMSSNHGLEIGAKASICKAPASSHLRLCQFVTGCAVERAAILTDSGKHSGASMLSTEATRSCTASVIGSLIASRGITHNGILVSYTWIVWASSSKMLTQLHTILLQIAKPRKNAMAAYAGVSIAGKDRGHAPHAVFVVGVKFGAINVYHDRQQSCVINRSRHFKDVLCTTYGDKKICHCTPGKVRLVPSNKRGWFANSFWSLACRQKCLISSASKNPVIDRANCREAQAQTSTRNTNCFLSPSLQGPSCVKSMQSLMRQEKWNFHQARPGFVRNLQ